MSAVVVYESMFGCTRQLAEAVGEGIAALGARVDVLEVGEASARDDVVLAAEMLVVGAPTHMRGLSTPRTRALAKARGASASAELGVHEWLDALPGLRARRTAVFETRNNGRFAGSAGQRIEKMLRKSGADVVVPLQSFGVDADDDGRASVTPAQVDLAAAWGRSLAQELRPDPMRAVL
ncbi:MULTISPECIES: flavodoxin family protein [Cellulomonas]|uniref:Flavodoxin/nitric oxide synthase n=1 Tax=Cellulomonas gilvus (strain ATCC 13127 / NRRL B-14078) TaxID=593907 RepID=F8A1X6_CELGA|nr:MULTISPECIES: flavodoxin domain-containing protein [Cellulomonas]AEI12920.1 flavodoxin/nitric oxide synthase [Cellulomonas gilvus ATCC 13127]MCR6689328.1 flavodoxin domain-containing protein [Cellulomonas sp.]